MNSKRPPAHRGEDGDANVPKRTKTEAEIQARDVRAGDVGAGVVAPSAAALAKAKRVLELQEKLKSKLGCAPSASKRLQLADSGAGNGERAARKLEGDWRAHSSAHNDKRRHARSSLEFVERGKFQLQGEYERVLRESGEDAAKEAVREKKLELKKALRAQEASRKAQAVNLRKEHQDEAEARERAQVDAVLREAAASRARKSAPEVPGIEWWDARVLEPCGASSLLQPSYRSCQANCADHHQRSFLVRKDKITALVEHPLPLEPPKKAAPAPPPAARLLPKEAKKLRTQRRLEREKERQELIQQGLLERPPPRVKISNLVRVLGAESAADPTAIEVEVRRQMAERQQAHDDRNLANKLTPVERREKKTRKMFDSDSQTHVAVFRAGNVVNRRNRFKIRMNALQNSLSGRCYHGQGGAGVPFVLVVVEGCSKSIRRFCKLMTRRIPWKEVLEEDVEDATFQRSAAAENSCQLVWEGVAVEPAFSGFEVKEVRVQELAIQDLESVGVRQYWDLASRFHADHVST